MKLRIWSCLLSFALGIMPIAAQATPQHSGQPHSSESPSHNHEAIGKPGHGLAIARTIKVSISETEIGSMSFDPAVIKVETGTVLRFVITNNGALKHEFFLGAFEEIKEHTQWMHKHPEMRHPDANSIEISSGATIRMDWQFSDTTNLEFACLIPGHREAGLWGVILVHDHFAPKQD